MAKSKYGKYFIKQTKSSAQHDPQGGFPAIPLMWVDDRSMKRAFYFECIWLTGPVTKKRAYKPHCHERDEYVGFFGSDSEDPFNLNAEVQFWMNDEKHTIKENTLIFVPAGTWHGPVIVEKLSKPIFCLSTSPMTRYSQKVNRDPKYAHMPDPPENN